MHRISGHDTSSCHGPGLRPAILSEAFATSPWDAGVTGFALALIGAVSAPLLWVQDRMSRTEAGRPYLPGLGPTPLLHVDVSRAADVLAAMEDGLRCPALGGVIGEVWGDPSALGFTATKRLALRAETGKIPCWLIRRASAPNLSAARDRWRVTSLPSAPHPDDPHAPGDPRWRAELFRSRFAMPGEWVVHHDRATDRLDFSASFRNGAVADHVGKDEERAAG